VTVPLASLGVADKPDLTDFWIQDITGMAAPTFFVDDVTLDPAPVPSAINVAIDVKKRIRRVDPRTFGLNTAIWDGVFATADTAGLLAELDIQALRFPGGSLSDEYHWKTNSTDAVSSWQTSFDAFASIAQPARAQVFITVNYGSGTPEEAADWVRYA